jgi:tRNA G26 N,N-dimethylase Trm1
MARKKKERGYILKSLIQFCEEELANIDNGIGPDVSGSHKLRVYQQLNYYRQDLERILNPRNYMCFSCGISKCIPCSLDYVNCKCGGTLECVDPSFNLS